MKILEMAGSSGLDTAARESIYWTYKRQNSNLAQDYLQRERRNGGGDFRDTKILIQFKIPFLWKQDMQSGHYAQFVPAIKSGNGFDAALSLQLRQPQSDIKDFMAFQMAVWEGPDMRITGMELLQNSNHNKYYRANMSLAAGGKDYTIFQEIILRTDHTYVLECLLPANRVSEYYEDCEMSFRSFTSLEKK